MFGYDIREMVGRTTEFLHVDATALTEFRRHLFRAVEEEGFLFLPTFAMKRKEGGIFPTEHCVTPIRDTQGRRIGWVSVVRDITERRRAEDKLLAQRQQLRSLASELVLAEERERRRIAADLHDHACQDLALARMTLHSLLEGSPLVQEAMIREVDATVEGVLGDIRDLTFDLSSPTLYKFGLEAALEELLDDKMRGKHGLECRFFNDDQAKPLTEDLRVLLFRSVRELLVNVVKHARRTKYVLTSDV